MTTLNAINIIAVAYVLPIALNIPMNNQVKITTGKADNKAPTILKTVTPTPSKLLSVYSLAKIFILEPACSKAAQKKIEKNAKTPTTINLCVSTFVNGSFSTAAASSEVSFFGANPISPNIFCAKWN